MQRAYWGQQWQSWGWIVRDGACACVSCDGYEHICLIVEMSSYKLVGEGGSSIDVLLVYKLVTVIACGMTAGVVALELI